MSKFQKIKRKFVDVLLNESLDIHHKLLNLILAILFIGTLVGFIFSTLFVNDSMANYITLFVAVCIGAALFFSVKKQMQDVAAIVVSLIVNSVLFPIMYITQGGIGTGMPIWMLLGLAFNWLVLSGLKCYITFGIEAIVDTVLFVYETKYPEKIHQLTQGKMNMDVAQSMFMVALTFGALFKFQAYVYDKQKRSLEEREEQLKLANKAKSAFLANMSHEIRTPINAVLGMDELILREDIDPIVREYANNIDRSGKALLTLINDILDFSKIESGKMEIVPYEYKLSDLILDCYVNVQLRAQHKGLGLNIECDEKTPLGLMGDETRIRQVISNILTNAVKYTPKGSVTLSVRYVRIDEENICLIVSVTDTGMGISEDNIKVLFDSFQRVDEKKNRNIEGTGLGLSITKQLVELMDGEISVESEVGVGSTFTVRIPQKIVDYTPIGSVDDIMKHANEEKETYHESFTAPNAKILVVDDVKVNLEVVKGLLHNTKVQIDCVTSGSECIEKVKEKRYNIILMDHMMPVMDGIETLAELKKNELIDENTVVIALTANAISGVRDSYIKAGFADYLTKPIDGKTLEKAIKKYLPDRLVNISDEPKQNNTISNSKEKQEDDKKETKKEIKKEKKTRAEKFIDTLNEKSFVDTNLGMQYCGGVPNIYASLVREYYDHPVIDDIQKSFEDKNYKDYQIHVHGLKSSSLTMGFVKLSEEAKALEFACKEDRIDYVLENHYRVMDEYKFVLSELANIFGEK